MTLPIVTDNEDQISSDRGKRDVQIRILKTVNIMDLTLLNILEVLQEQLEFSKKLAAGEIKSPIDRLTTILESNMSSQTDKERLEKVHEKISSAKDHEQRREQEEEKTHDQIASKKSSGPGMFGNVMNVADLIGRRFQLSFRTIGALIGIFALANFEEIQGMFEKIKDPLINLGKTLFNLAKVVFPFLLEHLDKIIIGILSLKLIGLFTSIYNTLAVFGSSIMAIKNFLAPMMPALQKMLGPILVAFHFVKGLIDGITSFFSNLETMDWQTALQESVLDFLGTFIGGLANMVTDTVAWFAELFGAEQVAASLKHIDPIAIVRDLASSIVEWLQGVTLAILEMLNPARLMDSLRNLVTDTNMSAVDTNPGLTGPQAIDKKIEILQNAIEKKKSMIGTTSPFMSKSAEMARDSTLTREIVADENKLADLITQKQLGNSGIPNIQMVDYQLNPSAALSGGVTGFVLGEQTQAVTAAQNQAPIIVAPTTQVTDASSRTSVSNSMRIPVTPHRNSPSPGGRTANVIAF